MPSFFYFNCQLMFWKIQIDIIRNLKQNPGNISSVEDIFIILVSTDWYFVKIISSSLNPSLRLKLSISFSPLPLSSTFYHS